jgi:hypothetical protein
MPRNASHAQVAKNSRVLVVEDEWLIADEVCHQLLKAGACRFIVRWSAGSGRWPELGLVLRAARAAQ